MSFEKISSLKYSLFLYKINNDYISRKFSLNNKKFKYEDHLLWLVEKINSKKDILFVYKIKNKCVGYMRQETIKKKKFLSWSISPSERSRGYGKKMLLNYLKLNNGIYFAMVHLNNKASNKISLDLNFKIVKKIKSFNLLKFSKA